MRESFGGSRSARLAIALLCAASLSHAADLPDGTGKAETIKVCAKCHSIEQTTSLRQGQAGWGETISKMVNLGAVGSDEDLNKVLNYLVKFYGSGNATTGAGAEVAAAVASSAVTSSGVEGASRSAAAMTAKEGSLPTGGAIIDSTNIDPAKEWRTYGHDAGGMRFSPLTQIKPENVSQLKLAWTYHMRPPGFTGGGRGAGRRKRDAKEERWAMSRNRRAAAGGRGSSSARVSDRAK